ncbi:hypothetical protein ZIOFF_066224 [Zingiber officinale]|uniref:Uncharacterized protein n=1 Tax=Zingiber officinale TaxID=94328 RepID=A0A8J5EYD5_ZINOF|nr:hypothetical protein ZIOFF_066224 [Zingiber officinale]
MMAKALRIRNEKPDLMEEKEIDCSKSKSYHFAAGFVLFKSSKQTLHMHHEKVDDLEASLIGYEAKETSGETEETMVQLPFVQFAGPPPAASSA